MKTPRLSNGLRRDVLRGLAIFVVTMLVIAALIGAAVWSVR